MGQLGLLNQVLRLLSRYSNSSDIVVQAAGLVALLCNDCTLGGVRCCAAPPPRQMLRPLSRARPLPSPPPVTGLLFWSSHPTHSLTLLPHRLRHDGVAAMLHH